MGFLRRIFGGGRDADGEATPSGPDDDGAEPALDAEEEERQHELNLLRSEAERLDELAQRQLRYADHSWQPPAQGGERRADDDGSAHS